jgi:hypothetical protein
VFSQHQHNTYSVYNYCHLGWRTPVLKCNKNNYDWMLHCLVVICYMWYYAHQSLELQHARYALVMGSCPPRFSHMMPLSPLYDEHMIIQVQDCTNVNAHVREPIPASHSLGFPLEPVQQSHISLSTAAYFVFSADYLLSPTRHTLFLSVIKKIISPMVQNVGFDQECADSQEYC